MNFDELYERAFSEGYEYAQKEFGAQSKILGYLSPGSYDAKELARLESRDEDEYKAKRNKAAIKGYLAPITAANKYRKAAAMAEKGASPEEIKKAVGKIGADSLFLESLTAPVSHLVGRPYAYYQGLSHMDDDSRIEAKKRTKGR